MKANNELNIEELLQENQELKHRLSLIEEQAKLKYQNHLRYRLGNVIVENIDNPLKALSIPMRLLKAYKQYKEEHKKKENIKLYKFNEEAPLVSVIIAAYNCDKYINQCIDSLLNQSFKNFEIIVVDDGSTDRTYSILNEYKTKNKNLYIYRQKNKYAGVARNNGLSRAKGEYVLFLDADDFFERNMLMLAYQRAKSVDADIVVFKGREYNDVTKEFKNCRFPLSPELFPNKAVISAGEFGEKLFQANSCIAWNKLISKKFIDKVGVKFSSTKSSNDTVFIYTLLSLAKRITLVNEILVNYRTGNPNSLQRSKAKSWECICIAFFQLKKKLIETGQYESQKRTFINKALQANLYYLSTIDDKTRAIMECSLNNKYFKLLDINKYAEVPNFIYNKNFRKQYIEIKQKKYIPIVYASDNNYAKYTSVSIQSILENSAQRNFLIFYILIDDEFSERNKELLTNQVEKYGHNIVFVNMKDAYKEENLKIAHISHHTYYRLQLPKILGYLNKLIYIDGDTIVLGDIGDLFDFDIKDSYFGGVKAPAFDNKKHRNRLGIDTSKYINAGVLLVNNRLLIKDKVQKKFEELLNNSYDCQDQDIINVAGFGKITLLPIKYNLMTKYQNTFSRFISEGKIDKSEFDEAIKYPLIIHYADKIKPWDDKTSWLAAHYWEYAEKSPFYITNEN